MSRAVQAKIVMDSIKKLAKTWGNERLNDIRLVVAIERAIARLERHPQLADHLVFKGGFVLFKVVETDRFTRDLDALALEISRSSVVDMVKQAMKVDLHDGLWFGDPEVTDLKNQGPYGGYTFKCVYQIGDPPKEESKIKKLSRINIDIGFGDALKSLPAKKPMQSILADIKPVSWSIYPLEYIFAEKLEALFSRGSLNSRAKDIYDLQLIFPDCDLDKIAEAVTSTFNIRETPIPSSFKKTGDAMDTVILRRAWGSVELPKSAADFDDCWNGFLSCLGDMDKAMSSKSK